MSARRQLLVEREQGTSRRRTVGNWRVRASLGALIAVCSSGGLARAQGAPAVLWQASDGASTVAYSRDGRLVADAGSGVYVTIRDAATGALIRSIRDKSGINAVDFSPNGALIAEGRTNGSASNLKVYRVSDGILVLGLGGHSNATRSLQFSPDGSRLASGGDDKTAKIWRTSDGVLVRTLAQGGRVRSVAFSPDGQTLAVGDQLGAVKVWRTSDGALVRTLAGFAGNVSQVTYSPDGSLLAAASLDGTIRLWRATDGVLVRVLTLPASVPNGSVSTLAFTPDGATLLSGNDEVTPSPEHGTVRFHRVADGALLGFDDQQTGVYVRSLAVAPGGAAFAYARSIDGVVTSAQLPR